MECAINHPSHSVTRFSTRSSPDRSAVVRSAFVKGRGAKTLETRQGETSGVLGGGVADRVHADSVDSKHAEHIRCDGEYICEIWWVVLV